MIVKAEKRHIDEICVMWCEAFGDKPDSVLDCLDFLLEYIFVAEIDAHAVSMAAAIPVTFGDASGRYVYAVATKKEYRGQGLSSKILEFLKDYIEKADEKFLVLVPAEESLFEFYEKRGFDASDVRVKKTLYNAENSNADAVQISAERYHEKREEYRRNLIAFDVNTLAFAKEMYDGEFLEAEIDGEKIGVAFCFCTDDKVILKEIFADNGKLEKTLDAICRYFGKKTAEYVSEDKDGDPFFMAYPKKFAKGYFNIALD